MKRFVSILLAVTLTFGVLPIGSLAAINSQDADFQAYLQEVGMSEEEFLQYLNDMYEFTLEDFESVSELKNYLGEVLTEENLKDMLEELDITEEELNLFLEETGASLDDYVFFDDLYFKLSEWQYQEDLTPITDESLKTLLEQYGFETKEELEKLLNDAGDSIENYQYIEELEWAISEQLFMQAKDDFIDTLDSFGLSLSEANKLANHVFAIMENPDLDVDQFFGKMEEIGMRLMSFPEFDSAEDLSAEDIAEFIDIWNDLLELMELKVEYYLTKDGQVSPVSFASLLQMDSTNGADLLIKIYLLNGEFLADMIITKDMFDSEFMEETGQNFEQTKDTAQEAVKAAEKAPVKVITKTVKGGQLPNTASNYLQNSLAGLVILFFGIFIFRKVKAARV